MRVPQLSPVIVILQLAVCILGVPAIVNTDVSLWTNAKRLAAGLPLGKPRKLFDATRVLSAPRQLPSNFPPVTVTCHILVKDADSLEDLGYISANQFDGGYAYVQSASDGALQVQFSYSNNPATELSLLVVTGFNAGSSYPYFGGIVETDSGTSSPDIGSGNSAFFHIGGTAQTAAGSGPVVSDTDSFELVFGAGYGDIESAIWSYDFATQELQATWVNSDGSPVNPTYLALLQFPGTSSAAFVGTGDPGSTNQRFPNPKTFQTVTFTCIP